ncbi:histidine phosphatase family protein [Tetrasphaera sp. F2B08]|uniref:histidine phosphatase family protein n=1 Tax=Nostocoides sp. F2B08 TaxID=2653936 RepID=UPI001D0469A6
MIRHAESIKNIDSQRGGPGRPLTARGEAQALDVSHVLLVSGHHWDVVITGPGEHVVSTSQIVSKQLALRSIVSDCLSGIDLGVLAGLTEAEMAIQQPRAWAVFQAWDRREIAMSEFVVAGKESGTSFAERVLGCLVADLRRYPNPLFVVGRSILILCANIVRSEGIFDLETFFHEEWGHCSGLFGRDRLPMGRSTR